MFQHIRKHQQWLFVIIIVVIIISFVIFFTPEVSMGGYSGPSSTDIVATYNGRSVTRDEMRTGYLNAMLQFFMRFGQWPDQGGNRFGYDLEFEGPNQYLLSSKAEELKIYVSPENIANWIVTAFQDASVGTFDKEFYETFVNERLATRGIDEKDFQNYVEAQISVGQLNALAGMPGSLITPREAEREFREQNLQASTSVVFFSSTNYANLTEDLAGLEDYYTRFSSKYRVPEQRRINYVKFAATNYLAEAEVRLTERTNLTELIDQIYAQRGTNAFRGTDGQPLPEEQAREKIREEEVEKGGLEVAKEYSVEFAKKLYEKEDPDYLPQLAAAEGYVCEVTEPFASTSIPKGIGSYQFTQQAFRLSEEEPFVTPIRTSDAYYLISLHSEIPSEVPPLDSIRGRVTVDYYEQKALESARAAGSEFYTTLTNSLPQGKTFETLCQEAGLTPVDIPLFSLQTTSLPDADRRANLTFLKNNAFALKPGEVSRSLPIQDGAAILYLKSFVPVDEANVQEELPEFIETLRTTRSGEMFSAWYQQLQSGLQLVTTQTAEPAPDVPLPATDGTASN